MEALLKTLSGKAGWIGRKGFSTFAEAPVATVKAILQGLADVAASANELGWKGEWTSSDEQAALMGELWDATKPELISETEEYYDRWAPLVKWTMRRWCDIGIAGYSFFCDNTEKSRLQVAAARFSSPTVQAGLPAQLEFTIGERLVSLDIAENSHVYVDWGDGERTDLRWGTAHDHKSTVGTAKLAHTYRLLTDESTRTFTAYMHVQGDNDSEYEHFLPAEVRIVRDINPITIDFQGPTRLTVDEIGDWTMDVSGGLGPYRGELTWGGGSTGKATSDFGTFRKRHGYATAGIETITLDVTDSDQRTASRDFTVNVVDVDGGNATCNLDYQISYSYQPQGAAITLSGSRDYPEFTWTFGDDVAVSEFELEAAYSANVYHLLGEIPATVRYGEYGYPGTTPGPGCYFTHRDCTEVVPLTQESHYEYGYDVRITGTGGELLSAHVYAMREVCN